MNNESLKYNKKREKILNRALIDIANHGFNKKMLHIAAKNCNVSEGELGRLFPEGIFELKQYFFNEIDIKMLKKIDTLDYSNIRIRDKIYNGVIIRLDLFKKNKKSIKHIFAPGIRVQWINFAIFFKISSISIHTCRTGILKICAHCVTHF